jgi:hypothetical protein
LAGWIAGEAANPAQCVRTKYVISTPYQKYFMYEYCLRGMLCACGLFARNGR